MKELLSVLGAVLAVVLPLVRAYIQTHLTPRRLEAVAGLARMAVAASEQMGGDNRFKFRAAADALTAAAKRVGVRLKPAEVNGFIESALREMKQYAELEPLDLDTFGGEDTTEAA